jgi:SAM-dependent methyltransferase
VDIDKLLKEKSGIKLDFGCGANKHGPDWVGFDRLPLPGVDIVHDMLDIPYPLPDECVSVGICSHVFEHIPKTQVISKDGKLQTINPLMMVMDELWRVMKPDASFAVAVPHGASPGFMQDPTHASQLNENTWAYFDPLMYDGLLYNFYKPKPWKLRTNERGEPLLSFDPSGNMEVVLVKRRMDVSYG